jgi:fibronectin type 3 domain-containing protein
MAQATYEVELTWEAPASSSDPVAGYHVYRATGSGSYALLNSSIDAPTTYTDTTVQAGATYNYEVRSVDASGVESVPSNVYTATIP